MKFKLYQTLCLVFSLLCLSSCYNNTEKVRVVRYLNYNPKVGENFKSVACRFGLTTDALNEINPEMNEEFLQPGKYIKVPVSEYTYSVVRIDPSEIDSCLSLDSNYVCGRPVRNDRVALNN